MEDDIRALHQMMPDMDREVIVSVLESHGGHMEAAAESLLAMGTTANSQQEQPNREQPFSPPPQGALLEGLGLAPHGGVPRDHSRPHMAIDEMLAQSLQQEELLEAAQAHSQQPHLLNAYRQQAARPGSALSSAVEGVASTLSSVGGAAYSGLTSLVSKVSAFSSCVSGGPSALWSASSSGAGQFADGESAGRGLDLSASGPRGVRLQHRANRSGAEPEDSMSVPNEMSMTSPPRRVAEEDSSPAVPSYTRLVHRRGQAAKKDD